MKPPRPISILSWNVNGLRSIVGKGFGELIERRRPDVICLQETKIPLSEFAVIAASLENYHAFLSPAERPGYSGVATFVSKATFPEAPVTTSRFGPKDDAFSREGRILCSTFDSWALYNLYIPSGTSGEDRQGFKYSFLESLSTKLHSLKPEIKNRLILCGDFNICHKEIDIHHPKEAARRGLTGFLPEERAWMDSLVDIGFSDSYRLMHPTTAGVYSWWTYRAGARGKNLGWRIDYHFVSSPLAKDVHSCELLVDVTGSDHCPCELSVAL